MNKSVIVKYSVLTLLLISLFFFSSFLERQKHNLITTFIDDEIVTLDIRAGDKSIRIPEREARESIATIKNLQEIESKSAGVMDYVVRMEAVGIGNKYRLTIFKNKSNKYFYVNLASGRTKVMYSAFDELGNIDSILEMSP